MEKYYTPTIEEFHIGFRYEYRHMLGNQEWEQKVFDKYSFESKGSAREINDFDHACIELEENKNVRVKYLDQQDITAEGWEVGNEGGTIYGNINKHGIDYFIDFRPDLNYVKIHVLDNAPKDDTLFSGTIKNRSELHRLMQQLGIK